MQVIGISGKIGTGKSTLADYVEQAFREQGEYVMRLAFAELLRREAADHFNFPVDLTYTQSGKSETIMHPGLPNGYMTVREILQWWGTDVRRVQDPAYWTKKMDMLLFNNGKKAKSSAILLVDDVRFANEARWVLEKGGVLVRLHPYEGWQPGENAGHKSETDLDDWTDWTLELTPEYGSLEMTAELVKGVWDNVVAHST